MRESYYAQIEDYKGSYIRTFRYWKEMEGNDYLFGKPTYEQSKEWIRFCRVANPAYEINVKQLVGYESINQFVTVQDFYGLWYNRGDSLKFNDDLTLWRLEQYDTVSHSPNSEYERFSILKERINSLTEFDSLFQVDLNFWASFKADLQEFYDRVLLRETIGQSDDEVAIAFKKENDAWLNYHVQVDSAFRIIDGNPEGMVGSAWSMAISGIREDDALIRESSLNDFYFTLTDGPEKYDLERHVEVSEKKVLNEYKRFMDSFVEDEAYYPVPERKEALSLEMKAWNEWMVARNSVSSLLYGQYKEAYDNATNNVRRIKYIMLKNRYSGYGVTSNDVYELLIPYTVSDEELDGPSFDEKWNHLLGN
ncbi:MAG: hypothetical protein IKW99_03720 [Bacteroidales bacterium]|nr:hypothetical protein [Bacteroidales bacterium]